MEENILVSNIIYISSIVLCLILIIILFKQLRTTNKLLKTTQDKFHTKLSALENKYASGIDTKSTITIQKEITKTSSTKYDTIVNNIPTYSKKLFITIVAITLPAIILYILYFTADSFQESYSNVLGLPYLNGLNKINLWGFYTKHYYTLLFIIASTVILFMFYMTGGLGVLNPSIHKMRSKILYNFLIASVACSSSFIYLKAYQWEAFITSTTISTIIFIIIGNWSDKSLNKPSFLIKDKIIIYLISALSFLYLIIWLPISAVSVNSYFAKQAGEKKGKELLATILDNKYLKSRNHIILKATQENIYLLDCEGSECTGLRKINDDKVAFTFFERKDFTFYSESKEKTD